MRLNRVVRARANRQIEAGRRLKDVAAALGVNRSTITRLRQRYVQTGSVEDRPRPGQPRVTSQRKDRAMRLSHLRRRFCPATETAKHRGAIDPEYALRLSDVGFEMPAYVAADRTMVHA